MILFKIDPQRLPLFPLKGDGPWAVYVYTITSRESPKRVEIESQKVRQRCTRSHVRTNVHLGVHSSFLSSNSQAAALGISSHIRPSSLRPDLFLFVPPHCLKKKATPASKHWSLISVTHSFFIGLAPGPDSPPTIIQSMPARSSSGIGPSKGSIDRNFTNASVCLRMSIL